VWELFEKGANGVLFWTLGVAVVLVAVRAVMLFQDRELKLKPSERLGDATWSFSDSWASNLTAVGAILTAVLAETETLFSSDGTTTHLASPGQYVALSLVFGLLLLVAPFAYNATKVERKVGQNEVQAQGLVVAFLLASAITLWAVLGQLWLVFFLIGEAQVTNVLPEAAADASRSVIFLVGVAGLVYTFVSIGGVLEHRRARAETGKVMYGEPERDQPDSAARSWSLL
jgi:hypothetical protein